MDKDRRPPNQPTSFLIRLRTQRKGGVRYQVQHIQSGEEVEGDTLEAVMAWLERFRQERGEP
ncbi:MAG: hypothetical protein SFU83_23275 [Meiothermus sp.]|nr:hypothetical protein [Meiothermus sp.]